MTVAIPAELLRASHGALAGAAALALRETVMRLRGCLGALPGNLRLVLALRTGVGAPAALTPAAIAVFLDTSVAHVRALERRGVARLRSLAQSSGCGRAAEAPGSPASNPWATLTSLQPAFAEAPATAPAPAQQPTRLRPAAQHGVAGQAFSRAPDPLGIGVSAEASLAIEIALLALGGVVLAVLLFGDRLAGLRNGGWRSR